MEDRSTRQLIHRRDSAENAESDVLARFPIAKISSLSGPGGSLRVVSLSSCSQFTEHTFRLSLNHCVKPLLLKEKRQRQFG